MHCRITPLSRSAGRESFFRSVRTEVNPPKKGGRSLFREPQMTMRVHKITCAARIQRPRRIIRAAFFLREVLPDGWLQLGCGGGRTGLVAHYERRLGAGLAVISPDMLCI